MGTLYMLLQKSGTRLLLFFSSSGYVFVCRKVRLLFYLSPQSRFSSDSDLWIRSGTFYRFVVTVALFSLKLCCMISKVTKVCPRYLVFEEFVRRWISHHRKHSTQNIDPHHDIFPALPSKKSPRDIRHTIENINQSERS